MMRVVKLKWFNFLFLAAVSVMVFAVNIAHAESQVVPLKPDEAFVMSVDVAADNETLQVNWSIAPGYFLYTDRLNFSSEQAPLVAKLPVSKARRGLDGVIEQVYSGRVSIPVVIQVDDEIPSNIDLAVSYQGCAANGFCYPPMKQIASINMVSHIVTYENLNSPVSRGWSWMRLLTDHNKIKVIFSTEHFTFTLFVFFVLGILLAFTPCVLPMLPILTGIIVGEKKLASTRRAFFLSLTYVLGVAVAYAGAGVLATLMGQSIQVWMQQPLFVILLATFLVLLAFSMFEFFDLPISRRWQNIAMRWGSRHQGGTYVGVFLMGIFSTLIVSPCITAPMIGVLVYIAQTGNLVLGASALFVMGLGMGVPLIIVGMSAGKFLPKSGPWMRVIVKLFGLLLLGMAVWLVSRLIPQAVTVFIWGLYAIGVAAFMFVIMPELIRHRYINRSLGAVFALVGVVLILSSVGVLSYIDEWTGMSGPSVEAQQFMTVHNVAQLESEIAKASSKKLPVLVDFYADWCEACVVMDKKVFSLESTQVLLQGFDLIRVDLTENTAEDQALMQKYNVIAPPTILFFTESGKEVTSKRIVGGVDADEFAERIHTFRAFKCTMKANC